MHTKEQLISDLKALGIKPGDTILMHSSYKSLGGIEDGAKGFFDAFLSLLGEEGTLVLPALTYANVNREQTHFDVRTTPTCVGYLTEFFRTQVEGVIRSLHPTHSCCVWGRHAKFLTENHYRDRTPVGTNSPFALLPKVGGKLLFVGCSYDRNTTMHGVEEWVEPEYVMDRTLPVVYEITDENGNTFKRTHLKYHFHRDEVDYEQKYSRMVDIIPRDKIVHGKLLDADCVLMDSAAVWETGVETMKRDPYFFVNVHNLK